MPGYARFARFYDAAMDDPTPGRGSSSGSAGTTPTPASVLELGCGTGSILVRLTGFLR